MNILILFGSTSDAPVYEPIFELCKQNHNADFEVISAHRNPDRLEARLDEKNFDAVIAGAGISAHLPGVVASKVKGPVFGVPVGAQFGGLDAVMSIQMMPYGVPVLMCGPDRAAQFLPFIEATYALRGSWNKEIGVIVPDSVAGHAHTEKELKRLKELAEAEAIELTFSSDLPDNLPRIRFISEAGQATDHPLEIAVPLLAPTERKSPQMAVDCFEWTTEAGLWVCVNNSRNALLFFRKAITGA